jgi:hypothetical protein
VSWFRFYGEVINDPKVQKLTPTMFKHWVNVLCLASMHDGVIPLPADVAFAMRISEGRAAEMLDELLALNLMDADDEGTLRPHNWSARQYKSDTSTERVRKHRRNVSVTPPDTEDTEQKQITEQSRTETDPDTEALLPFEPPSTRSRSWEDVDLLLPSLIEDFGLVDVPRELGKAKDWLLANGKKKKDHVSFFRNWLRRAEEYSNDRRAQPEQRRSASEPSPFAYLRN